MIEVNHRKAVKQHKFSLRLSLSRALSAPGDKLPGFRLNCCAMIRALISVGWCFDFDIGLAQYSKRHFQKNNRIQFAGRFLSSEKNREIIIMEVTELSFLEKHQGPSETPPVSSSQTKLLSNNAWFNLVELIAVTTS